MFKVTEISSGRIFKPNIPSEPKLGYILMAPKDEKDLWNAVGGKAGFDLEKLCEGGGIIL